MENLKTEYEIDYIEIYTPMAKLLAYWHQQVLGFTIEGIYNSSDIEDNKCSFVLRSGAIRLVLTSTFPSLKQSLEKNKEITQFISKNHCGVKRIALVTEDVNASFNWAIKNGGIALQSPCSKEATGGKILEASIKLYDDNEILFIDRKSYSGYFKPGYKKTDIKSKPANPLFSEVDHIAAELQIDETHFWTDYLTKTIRTKFVQSIEKSSDNKTGNDT